MLYIPNIQHVRYYSADTNYQKKEKENLQLRESNVFKIFWLIVIGVAAALAIMTLLMFIQFYKLRQQTLLERYKNLKRIKNENFRRSSAYIKENRQRIKVLTKKLNELVKDNSDLKDELEREKERLISATTVAEIGLKEKTKADDAVMNSPVYKLFVDKGVADSNEQLTNEDWHNLEVLLNREYDQFAVKLRSMCKLSEIEYRVSLLRKIAIKPVVMSRLLHTSKENISTIRSRLYQRNFGKKGTAKDWDEFLKSF